MMPPGIEGRQASEEIKMVQVTELGYIGFGVKNADEWKRFATEIVGLELADDGEPNHFYLRMDNWHHRLTVHTNGDDDLEYLGFRVAGPDEFGEIQNQLREAGIKYRSGSDDEAVERH